jgi:hypothetical protein
LPPTANSVMLGPAQLAVVAVQTPLVAESTPRFKT